MTKREKKKGKCPFLIPVFLRILAVLILVAIFATCIPLSVPIMLGYKVYNIVSPSMEPAIGINSVVYVKSLPAEEVQVGDVIAFYRDGDVVTHRVTENRQVEGFFNTKGDANSQEDMDPVFYRNLIGKVTFVAPLLGNFVFLYTGKIGAEGFPVGKFSVICLLFSALLMLMLARALTPEKEDPSSEREALEAEEKDPNIISEDPSPQEEGNSPTI